MGMSLTMSVTLELGGYTRNQSRYHESWGNAPNWHSDQVCRRPGGRVSAPASPSADGGQWIQQHNWPILQRVSPGHSLCCEHHGSAVRSRDLTKASEYHLSSREPSRGRLWVLALQRHISGEGPSVVLQWLLHPERLPAVNSSNCSAPWELVHTGDYHRECLQRSINDICI